MALRLGLRHELSPQMSPGEQRALVWDLKNLNVAHDASSRLDLGNFVEDMFAELDKLREKLGENA